MDVPTPASVLEALAKERRELQGELDGLAKKRSGLERELEGVDKDIESTRRQLELVEATEEQLAAQGREQQATDADGASSTQVRRSTEKLQNNEPVWPTWHLHLSCDSLRQRLPLSGPGHLRPMPSRSLSRSP
jgi:hypothetical protein